MATAQLRIGDLVRFEGVFSPVIDMHAGRSGAKVLNFPAHEPRTVTGPIIVYRPIDFDALADSLRYLRAQ